VKINLLRKPTALLFAFFLSSALVFPAVSQEVSPEGRETPGKETETVETAPPETGGETEALTETGTPEERDVKKIELKFDEEDEEGLGEIEADEGDVVKIGQDLYVAEGEVVPGDAVCIDGDLTIAGTVHGDAVCASGDIILESTAVVNGDVVSIGGCIDKAAGAEVKGQEVCIGGKFAPLIPFITKFTEISKPITQNIINIVWEIVFFLFLMFLGLLLSVFMKRQMDNVHDHLTNEFPRSALLGIALAVLGLRRFRPNSW
jgi:hypothetical protein